MRYVLLLVAVGCRSSLPPVDGRRRRDRDVAQRWMTATLDLNGFIGLRTWAW